jgi:hypothetical protein
MATRIPASAGSFVARIVFAIAALSFCGALPASAQPALPTVTPVVLGSSGQGSGLMQASDGNYYGTNQYEGAYSSGYIYRISPSGTFTDIYDFTGGGDGYGPFGTLVEASDGNLYGVTHATAMFKISLTGVFTPLGGTPAPWAPSDGFFPASDGKLYLPVLVYDVVSGFFVGGLNQFNPTTAVSTLIYSGTVGQLEAVQGSDGLLYFTGEGTGANTLFGTLNSMNLDGTNAQLLHSFGNTSTDGILPVAPLVEAPGGTGGILYGMTQNGGSSDYSAIGTIFSVAVGATASSSYSQLETLNNAESSPKSGLLLGGEQNLYGLGYGAYGNLFQFNSGTVAIADLYGFDTEPGITGAFPSNSYPLEGSDGNLYVTTSWGTTTGDGAIVQMQVSPPLPAPLQLTAAAVGTVGTPINVAFLGTNTFSDTMQQCNAFATNITTGDFYKLGAVAGAYIPTTQSSAPGYGGTFTANPTRGGAYSIGVNCGGIESATAAIQIYPYPSTPSVYVPDVTAVSGTPVTIDVYVQANNGGVVHRGVAPPNNGAINTGSVSLDCSGHSIGTLPVKNGFVFFTPNLTGIPAGIYNCTAHYSNPGGNYYAANGTGSITITPQTSSITLTSSQYSYSRGQKVTLNVAVTGQNTTPTAGFVNFTTGSTYLGTAQVNSSGLATMSYTTTDKNPPGSYLVVATYSGVAGFTEGSNASHRFMLYAAPPIGPANVPAQPR